MGLGSFYSHGVAEHLLHDIVVPHLRQADGVRAGGGQLLPLMYEKKTSAPYFRLSPPPRYTSVSG